MAHAKWATDTVYQNYALWFWSNTMNPLVREKFTRFLRSRGYDPNNRELLANEMQAFLMHTPDPAMFNAECNARTRRCARSATPVRDYGHVGRAPAFRPFHCPRA